MNVVAEKSRFTLPCLHPLALHGLLPALFAGVLWVAPAAAQLPGAPTAPVPAGVPAVANPAMQQTQSNQQQSQKSTQQNSQDQARDRRAADEQTRREASSSSIQESPTEFQRLVQESTGTALPIFGASLFSNVPDTFAHVDDIPVAANYVLGPGDELRVQLYGQVNQQLNFTVDRNGDISVPTVGTVHVAGVRYDQLSAFLKSQLDRVYRNFDVAVNLGQLRSIQIYVTGDARRPGAYTVSSLSTLLNAIFASGGPLPQGSMRDFQLHRRDAAGNEQTVVHFDLYDLLLKGDKSKDAALAPGDVLFIPPVGEQVAVAGSVNNPAIYEITPGTTVNQLIQLAGGETSVAMGSQVRLERIFEHTMRSIVDVPRSTEVVLAAGDIVSVGAILNKYADAVTLRGNVTSPGRYVWHPGMRIKDLVPSVNQLITRDYYRRRNALGNNTLDYIGSAPVAPSGGSLALKGNSGADASANPVVAGSATTSGAAKGGNSVGEALTSSNNVFGAQNDLILSAPDIDWNYAVIERLDAKSLSTSLIPFNPGELYKQNDESQNLDLLAGDVVTFFSTADLKVPTAQQTRNVYLEGEFIASGVYSVQPGETLRHLLARAGGFTPDAYLYGSEFTRKSTQRVQQQRLNEYADSLDAEISVLSSSNNARAISDRDAAAASASAIDGREAVARLRRAVPLGRIVLELKPDSRGIDSIPDLPLEDGDRFVVPRVPSTVSVEGQVYSANSYVFERGRKERDYLRQAGGPDRQADRKRTFILRADGSVYSRQYGDVDKATMFPGDTIVVPPQLDRHAFLRDLVDISTVITGFGLGAAAVNLLR